MARDPRLLFHAKSLLIRAILGNDAPAIACKAPRNHARLANPKDGVLATPCAPHRPTCATLPFGSVGYENQINERGERLIWLEPNVVKRLRAMRGPGEFFSDAILRLVAHAGSDEAR